MANYHGNTPAAWTTVIIIIAGFTVGGVGIVLARPAGAILGGVIIVVGCVVGKVMQLMGLGKSTASVDWDQPGYAERAAEVGD